MVEVERADTGERRRELRLAVLRRRLLPLRRGLHPALRGPGALHRADRPSPALARGPRLRRQAGAGHRQRRHRGHPGAGPGGHRRARDDAAAHPDLRAAGALGGRLANLLRRCSARSAATRSPGARTSPSSARSGGSASGIRSARSGSSAGSTPRYLPGLSRRRALQPALRAMGPAAVRGARRRPVQGHHGGDASVVTDRIAAFTERGIRSSPAASWRPTSSSPRPA